MLPHLTIIIMILVQLDAQQFSIMDNTNSPGGVLQMNVRNLADCISTCLSTGCSFGFDYIQSSGQCWISRSTATGFQQGVQHFTFRQIAGSNTCFAKSSDRSMLGGVRQNSISDATNCQSACLSQPGCLAVDFDRMKYPNECWLLRIVGTLYSSPGVDHYEKVNCPNGDAGDTTRPVIIIGSTGFPGIGCQTWSNAANMNSPGGILQAGVLGLENCQNACMRNGCANGFDYNSLSRECWISSSPNKQFANGIQHWTCGSMFGSSTGSITGFTTNFGLVQTGVTNFGSTVPAGVTNFGSTGQPAENFESGVPNTKVDGGSQLVGISELELCQSACLSQPACAAVTFDNIENQCWMSTTVGELVDAPQFIHYDYVCSRCATGVCFSDAALNRRTQWITLPLGLNLDEIQCMNACKDDPDCVGIDYNYEESHCYVLRAQNVYVPAILSVFYKRSC